MSSNGQRPHTRKFVRAPVSMPVEYSSDSEDLVKVGHAVDLGGGGMRLATEDDLPQGTFLFLRFRLPGSGREVLARARIVLSFFNAESKRYYHGIAFTQIDPNDQVAIVRFIEATLAHSDT
jgi:c-di-GMP-binding flagellar brake protein YcgR